MAPDLPPEMLTLICDFSIDNTLCNLRLSCKLLQSAAALAFRDRFMGVLSYCPVAKYELEQMEFLQSQSHFLAHVTDVVLTTKRSSMARQRNGAAISRGEGSTSPIEQHLQGLDSHGIPKRMHARLTAVLRTLHNVGIRIEVLSESPDRNIASRPSDFSELLRAIVSARCQPRAMWLVSPDTVVSLHITEEPARTFKQSMSQLEVLKARVHERNWHPNQHAMRNFGMSPLTAIVTTLLAAKQLKELDLYIDIIPFDTSYELADQVIRSCRSASLQKLQLNHTSISDGVLLDLLRRNSATLKSFKVWGVALESGGSWTQIFITLHGMPQLEYMDCSLLLAMQGWDCFPVKHDDARWCDERGRLCVHLDGREDVISGLAALVARPYSVSDQDYEWVH